MPEDNALDPLDGHEIIIDGEKFETSQGFYERFFPSIADNVGKALFVDGKRVDTNDMTFKEQRTIRNYVRDLTGDAGIEPENASLMDYLPAVVAVVKQREDANFSVDQALEIPQSEVWRREESRPTKAKATRSTGGRTGTRATS